MEESKRRKLYEAAMRVCLIAVSGNDVEVDEGNFEQVVDEELIPVIETIGPKNEPVSKDSDGVTIESYIRRNRYTKKNVLSIDVTCDAVQQLKPGYVIIQIRNKEP